MRFTVMTFNVLFGGGDEGRFRDLVEVIERAGPDLVVLQECLGWSPEGPRMEAVAAALGLSLAPEHAVLGEARPRDSGRRYHVAAFSRFPMVASRCHAHPAFQAHALLDLDVQVGPQRIRCFGTHLDAHSETLRFVEARYLRSLLAEGDLERRAHLLLGDLNSLSHRDPYPGTLAEDLARSGTTKYGHPPRREVIPELEEMGWRDALYARGTPPDTWVTATRERGGVRIDYRTDYVFLSAPLVPCLRAARILPLDREESDHLPVVVELDL